MYGEGAVTGQMCQKWFVKFCAGDFSLEDAPWPGRPVEVDSNQIKILIKNNKCSTMWELADILKISRSMKLLVKMKNVSFILWKKLNRLCVQPNNYKLENLIDTRTFTTVSQLFCLVCRCVRSMCILLSI